MIRHFLNVTLRNLSRQKGLAAINISGLAIGLGCFILFLLYAVNEFSFDKFHSKGENIYRMYRWTEAMQGEVAGGDVYMPMPLAPSLKQDFADVEKVARFREGWGDNFIKVNGQVSRKPISFTDPEFFNMFDFKIIAGNSRPLNDYFDLVITRDVAKNLFGEEDPIGKTIEIKNDGDFEPFVVRAVAENVPSNSTIQFEILGHFGYLGTTPHGKTSVNNWNRSAYQTFVQLKDGSTLAKQPERLLRFRKKYYPDEESELRKAGYWKEKGVPVTYGMQPLQAIHTDTKITGGSVESIKPSTIWLLIGIAGGLLLIACINFTTLAIGRSAGRAKEIGIRKVVGGNRKSLLAQFMMEALLLSLLSTIIGLGISQLLLPWFNQLSGRELSLSFSQFPQLIGLIAIVTLVVGLVAGSYPALVLSSFNPNEVLKSKVRVGGSNFFTKSLVTVQFVLSIGLIISTLIITQQLSFMKSKHPGFNKQNVIVVDAQGTEGKRVYSLFKDDVLKQPMIAGITSSELGIGENEGWSRSGFDYKGKLKEVYEYYVDDDFLKVMDMQLVAGRFFNHTVASDSITSVVINEAMMNDFGWTPETAIGQQLIGYQEKLTPEVIGVVKNFHYRPFSEPVLPQMFHQFRSYQPFKFFVRIKEGDPTNALKTLAASWKKIVPDYPFKYSFLDEKLDQFYKAESRWASIVGWAGGISIFLACLGLLGLAALTAINRTKEIGIRKVLGASVQGIIGLLSKDFLKLVVIALVIASPLAWYFMTQWLQDFTYRISIGWWIFILSGVVAVAIAFLTICVQAVKAATSNPVKSLRTE